MPRRTLRIPAKLSPPRLARTLARERLFAWLDEQLPCGALWIDGPPGAGKTTLVASYCQARSLQTLWYRLDADDNDAGQFFAHLTQAIARLGATRGLPLFAPEHLSRLQVYARAYFRAAFAVLPVPAALVFDNLEQAAWPSLAAVLGAAIAELPAGITLFMTSRGAPPTELARAAMGGALMVLPAESLAFTAEEARLYAQAEALDATLVAAVSRRVNGWAAGLRLLSHAVDTDVAGMQPQALFGYLAHLVQDALPAQGRHAMLVASLLPQLPSDLLATVAGVASAREVLDELCERNLFVERMRQVPGEYRLHPLLREFLVARAQRQFAPQQLAAIRAHAAREFAARGATAPAIDLFLDAGDEEAAAGLLVQELEPRLAAAQLDLLGAWFERLAPTTLQGSPWLLYGRARLHFLREDERALADYESAHRAFEAQGDLQGCQLCAAGMLEWGYNTDSFAGHERWGRVLQRAVVDAAPLREQHALRLTNGRLLACFFDGDFEARATTWVSEVLDLLTPGGAENEKLCTAITLLGCLERHKRWDEAQLLAGKMEALLVSPRIGPRLRILARQQIAVDLHRQTGASDAARRLACDARVQAHEQGFGVLEFEAVAVLLFVALYTGEEAETRKLLGELAGMLDPASVYHQRFAHQMQAWFALQCGDLTAAREHADALRLAVARSDMPPRFCATWLQLASYVSFAEGDEDGACAELESFCADAEPGSRKVLEANLFALRAWRHLRNGRRGEAAAALARAFALGAQVRCYQLLGPLRSVLAQLAGFALEQGIQPVFARELIQRRRLKPASAAAPHWPWPLRIRTLGHFALEVDGQALVFEGKLPKKPLALLKALIALGGHGVPEHALTDALWPGEEADAAHDAYNVALHRLRKLVPHGAEIIRLQDGHLSLDPGRCWIDCRAFEQLIDDAGGALNGAGVALEPLHAALALYQGRFLAEDDNETWSISARERLRSKFNRLVGSYGAALLRAGRAEEALACYKRGIEADDLAEEFYQGVMRCAQQLQQPAEGLAAYHRLERMLSLLLGVAPSPTSQALRRKLLGQ